MSKVEKWLFSGEISHSLKLKTASLDKERYDCMKTKNVRLGETRRFKAPDLMKTLD